MRRSIVLLCLLIVLCGTMGIKYPHFRSATNIHNTLRQVGLLGIFAIGVGVVIITGGIDLSVGSIIGLSGLLSALFLSQHGFPALVGVALAVGLGLALGALHGVLVAKLRLQPFIVTLCGLLIYRGAGRFITKDGTQGFGNQFEGLKILANGHLAKLIWRNGIPEDVGLPGWALQFLQIRMPVWILLGVACLATIFLHKSVYGRHLYALGKNEEAAKYSGIKTDRLKILAYIISGGLAGFAGILYALYTNTVQPATAGMMYELHAIAACVLGGCSLRGGEGTVLGIVLGAAVMPFLRNAVSMSSLSDLLEYAIIGLVILVTVIADEVFRTRGERRATKVSQ